MYLNELEEQTLGEIHWGDEIGSSKTINNIASAIVYDLHKNPVGERIVGFNDIIIGNIVRYNRTLFVVSMVDLIGKFGLSLKRGLNHSVVVEVDQVEKVSM